MVKITLGAVNPKSGSAKEYKTGTWRTMKPVYDKEKCIKCYTCYRFCPDSSIKKLDDGIEINYDYCKGCGICAEECRAKPKALTMVEEER